MIAEELDQCCDLGFREQFFRRFPKAAKRDYLDHLRHSKSTPLEQLLQSLKIVVNPSEASKFKLTDTLPPGA